MRIFISHAHADADLVEALIDLIIKALSISHDQIRCTSVDGYKLPGGASVSSQLRREVVEAELVVTVLTPTSLASSYVLFELGARWGCDKARLPFLSKGLTTRLVPAPLSDLNLVEIADPAQAFHFLESTANLLSLPIARPSVLQSSIAKVVQFSNIESPPRPSLQQRPATPFANMSEDDIRMRQKILNTFADSNAMVISRIAESTGLTPLVTRFYLDEMVREKLLSGGDDDPYRYILPSLSKVGPLG
jgi:TIR domain